MKHALSRKMLLIAIGLCPLLFVAATAQAAAPIDLSKAVVLISPEKTAPGDAISATVLVEELAARTGLTLAKSEKWNAARPQIILSSCREIPEWGQAIPVRSAADAPENKAEGYRVFVQKGEKQQPLVWIIGADARGLLFGVGEFLKSADWGKRKLSVDPTLDIALAPTYPIRGHQIGYRAAAHAWDAWTAEQFDQYFRDLALLGSNAIEGIPFQDERAEPLFKMTRQENNVLQSKICDKYHLDYWVWTPITFDLNEADKRAAELKLHEDFYKSVPRLDAVFFPGGDPGDNPPELVLPFMKETAVLLQKYHPKAKVWLSNQGFSRAGHEFVYKYLNEESPDWFGGLVNGPSSAPIGIERNHLPKKYPLRLYPDICHNKICQYQVPWWDMAFAMTLGREAINPRPVQYAYIHNWFASYSDGFISYSDGVGDDVNKGLWSELAFCPEKPVRQVMIDYARLFFNSEVGEAAADGILALEKNWRGPLIDNASVAGTLTLWQKMERQYPELLKNWRFQMCLVRAYYDAYLREKLIADTALENEVNAVLAQCDDLGSKAAIESALAILKKNDEKKTSPVLRERIIKLYDDLFKSIQMQSSVPKYGASGAERGASLDFIDLPLNNRFWLEDEFAKIEQMGSEQEKCEKLKQIAFWESPGPGGYYDDVGNPAKSDHVRHCEFVYTKPGEDEVTVPLQWWLNEGLCRYRLSQQVTLDWPEAVVYEGLDPEGTYVFRASGLGTLRIKINGEAVEPLNKERIEVGGFVDFPIDKKFLAERKIEITWIRPTDEGHLNWRQKSRLAEVWLLKK